ncbi:MAG: hypothetical protein U0L31_05685 [Bifidobacteriaceae bacterium]|nr:hypothetical protein [Bifidobacteriaceae bacterium]MEE0941366.1 hypothetical protein [Bifidobacteriaceae bacterium]
MSNQERADMRKTRYVKIKMSAKPEYAQNRDMGYAKPSHARENFFRRQNRRSQPKLNPFAD